MAKKLAFFLLSIFFFVFFLFFLLRLGHFQLLTTKSLSPLLFNGFQNIQDQHQPTLLLLKSFVSPDRDQQPIGISPDGSAAAAGNMLVVLVLGHLAFVAGRILFSGGIRTRLGILIPGAIGGVAFLVLSSLPDARIALGREELSLANTRRIEAREPELRGLSTVDPTGMARGRPDYLPPRRQRAWEVTEGRRVRRRLAPSDDNRSPAPGVQVGVSQTQIAAQVALLAVEEGRTEDVQQGPIGRQSESEARPTAGLLPGRDDEDSTVFIEGLSGYMAFERALTARDRDILRQLPSKAAGSRFYQDFSKAMALGYHCIHKMDEYEELWKAEQRKAHLCQVEVDRIGMEGQRVAEISKRNVEKNRRSFLENYNLVMEVAELKEDLASVHAELERERGEFEAKVQRRIDQHMASREVQIQIGLHWDDGFDTFRDLAQARWPDIDFGMIEPDGGMVLTAVENRTRRKEAEQPPVAQNQEAEQSPITQDREAEQALVAQDQEAEQAPLEQQTAIVDLEAEEVEHIAEDPTHGTVEDNA